MICENPECAKVRRAGVRHAAAAAKALEENERLNSSVRKLRRAIEEHRVVVAFAPKGSDAIGDADEALWAVLDET